MSIGAVSGLSGFAAAQSMFGVAAQAAGSVDSSGADAGASASGADAGAAAAEQASVAVLRMALDQERSLVNVLA